MNVGTTYVVERWFASIGWQTICYVTDEADARARAESQSVQFGRKTRVYCVTVELIAEIEPKRDR